MTENRLSGLGGLVIYVITTLLLIFIVAPLAVVIVMSFSEGAFAMFPVRGFTFSWYAKVIASPEFRSSFMLSLMLALSATLAAAVLGIPAAYALDRWNVPGARFVEAMLLSPLVLPSLIIGLALLQFFATARMYNTPVNIFIGHTLIVLPYMMRTVTASLKLVNRALEDAARTLGASPLTVFRRVTVPQITPGITAGALFALMISFDEYPLSMWLHNAETMPLPVYLYKSLNMIFDPSVAAISSLMVLTGIVSVVLIERVVGLRRAMAV